MQESIYAWGFLFLFSMHAFHCIDIRSYNDGPECCGGVHQTTVANHCRHSVLTDGIRVDSRGWSGHVVRQRPFTATSSALPFLLHHCTPLNTPRTIFDDYDVPSFCNTFSFLFSKKDNQKMFFFNFNRFCFYCILPRDSVLYCDHRTTAHRSAS